jgi:hypothetical protein
MENGFRSSNLNRGRFVTVTRREEHRLGCLKTGCSGGYLDRREMR